MREDLVDIISRYSDEFGVSVEFTDTAAKFVTDDGEIVLEEKDGVANLKRVEPLDETDDDQIMRLSKIRRHFSGYLRTSLEANKKASEPVAEPEPPKKKAGRPPKTEKTELPTGEEEPPKPRRAPRGTKAAEDAERAKQAKVEANDPPDVPIEQPPAPAEDEEEELPDLRPECDKTGKVLPEIYKLMKLRGSKQGLEVVEENLDHLVLRGEFGDAEVLANGEILSEVAGYIRILGGQPVKEPTSPVAKTAPAKVAASSPTKSAPVKESIFDQIIAHFGPDLMEVFGETGTMKSQGMVALAKQCAEAGRKVYYLDTENNISPSDVEMLRNLGVNYHYTPVLREIDEIFDKNIPAIKADVIIVDSVGMPVLRKFSAMSAHDRGSALLDIIKWLGVLKEWTYLNKSIAFVTNQPQSEFGKSSSQEKGDHRMPFGDKSNFIPGALLLSKKSLDSPQGSKAAFQVFRLRSHAWGEKIFEVTVDKNGPAIKLVV